jgi:hypothetical protein
MAGAFRRLAKKLNHSNPLRAPDGLAFPLPSSNVRFEVHDMPFARIYGS